GLIPQTLENQQTVCGLERNEPKRTRYEPKTNPTWAKQRNPKEINQKDTKVLDGRRMLGCWSRGLTNKAGR
ncbi:MAG TPA: hypothetical protein VI455_06890, partial [Terriglobia bacterium]